MGATSNGWFVVFRWWMSGWRGSAGALRVAGVASVVVVGGGFLGVGEPEWCGPFGFAGGRVGSAVAEPVVGLEVVVVPAHQCAVAGRGGSAVGVGLAVFAVAARGVGGAAGE